MVEQQQRQRRRRVTVEEMRKFIEALQKFQPSYVGRQSFSRGEDYYRGDHVRSVKITFAKVDARIQGTRVQPYVVTIRLGTYADGETFAETDCSCPAFEKYSGDCKHVAALYFFIRARLEEIQDHLLRTMVFEFQNTRTSTGGYSSSYYEDRQQYYGRSSHPSSRSSNGQIIQNALRILGLQIGVNKGQVRSRFRELSLRYHPDIPQTGDHERFIAIKDAYDLLMVRIE